MSILIKGMEMPKSCWRCPLCLTVDPDTYRCIPTGQDFESTLDAIDHIVLSCPLVPVPPHGRLIDAVKLIALCEEMQGIEWNNKAAPYSWAYAYESFENDIDNAPTIIEAEVVE